MAHRLLPDTMYATPPFIISTRTPPGLAGSTPLVARNPARSMEAHRQRAKALNQQAKKLRSQMMARLEAAAGAWGSRQTPAYFYLAGTAAGSRRGGRRARTKTRCGHRFAQGTLHILYMAPVQRPWRGVARRGEAGCGATVARPIIALLTLLYRISGKSLFMFHFFL